ncbi:hypothetical protein GJAV_G00165510 [Gymnothorax javanicus]|nr:hypothetical protein GJAV_G00165510 [Gymnothorax javanicus]
MARGPGRLVIERVLTMRSRRGSGASLGPSARLLGWEPLSGRWGAPTCCSLGRDGRAHFTNRPKQCTTVFLLCTRQSSGPDGQTDGWTDRPSHFVTDDLL